MKFTDLIDNYLRDYINESVTLNIISLIKTIKLCEDIENVKEYYNFKDKAKLLESKTKTAIIELLRELGYKQRIEIVFSKEK